MMRHTDEQYDKLRRLNNTFAEANMEQGKKLDDLRVELQGVEQMRDRAESQLAAEKATMQIVLDDNNRRYRAANEEVERLRGLLKENGVSPD